MRIASIYILYKLMVRGSLLSELHTLLIHYIYIYIYIYITNKLATFNVLSSCQSI